ncbi:hypothetical protein [Bradyrhizobium sp. USDA 3364]
MAVLAFMPTRSADAARQGQKPAPSTNGMIRFWLQPRKSATSCCASRGPGIGPVQSKPMLQILDLTHVLSREPVTTRPKPR